MTHSKGTFGARSRIVKWTIPVVNRIGVSTTARGSGPCPDGDGGSEAM